MRRALPRGRSAYLAPAARRALGGILLLVVASAARLATAHTNTRAHLDVRVTAQPGQLQIVLRAEQRTLAPLILAAAFAGQPIAAFLPQTIAAHVTIYDARRRLCRLTAQRLERPAGDLRFTADYRCPLGELELRYDLLYATDPDHRVFVTLQGLGAARLQTLDARHRTLRFEPRPTRGATFRHFLALGVHHIFGGYDHLLFLFALLLAAPLLRRASGTGGAAAATAAPADDRPELRTGLTYLIKIVSAFTVAHSVTLAVSALGWVRLPGRLVESAIAASIVWVALENLLWPTSRRRWVLVFVFGLVHGFGFAHVLAELGLPRGLLATTLVAFNLGVELGQLAVVALLFPLLHLLALPLRWQSAVLTTALGAALFALLALTGLQLGPWPFIAAVLLAAALVLAQRRGYRPVLLAGSVLVALLGLFWLLQRVLELKLLGGLLG